MIETKHGYPTSIGIIMDGNRRWARERGLPVLKGHEAGYKKLKEFVGWAKEFGINTVYAFAFSTENWNRPKEEIGYLMKLLSRAVNTEAKSIVREKIRVKFIGEISRLPKLIQVGIKKLEKATAMFPHTLAICLSYGGRADILNAVKKLSKEKTPKEIENLTEQEFSSFLWTYGLPNPELIIRTSGEMRISNFLLWQSAYSEWFFPKTYWPAFSKKEFEKILRDFSKRERRNGK